MPDIEDIWTESFDYGHSEYSYFDVRFFQLDDVIYNILVLDIMSASCLAALGLKCSLIDADFGHGGRH